MAENRLAAALTDARGPLPVGSPLSTVDDAMAEEVALAAVEDVVRRRRTDVRAWIADRPEIATALESGDGASVDTVYGTAGVTSPRLKPQVDDDAVFEQWVIDTMPEQVTTREDVNWSVVDTAMRQDPDLREAILHLLDGVDGATTVRTVMPEGLTRDLLKKKHGVVRDDGTVVSKRTGEVVPGLRAVPASTPSLRITPDKDRVAGLADSVYARITPLEAPEPDPEA